MSKKALYNLIRMNHGTTTFALPSGIYLADKTHTSGGRYFLFELPNVNKTRIDDLVLSSHHVSVYESPTGKIDLKSQYHYTAFFHNAAGEEFRLHVFFDSRDFLVTAPLLSVLREGKYEPVNSDDLDEVFAHLATTACSELVTFLRAAQKSKAAALQLQFKELENRLEPLSSDPVKNKKEYLEIIARQIQVLDELSKISNQASDVIKQMRWLITSKEIIESGEFQSESVSEHEDESLNAEPKGTHPKDETTPAKRKDKRSKKGKVAKATPKVKIQRAISDEVADLKLKFTMVPRLAGVTQLNLLNELYVILKEKEWLVELKERTATVRDLSDLRILRSSIEKSAGELLQRFLLQSDFNNAELLNQFYHLLPENMLLLALQSNRHQLLDFLLKHNIAPLNCKNLTIKSVTYSSMTDYFFNGPASDEQKMACLDVLIKRGASLMDIDNKTGLPYAALLLFQQTHPLRAVLERNQELTLNSIQFYSKMNQVLRSLTPESRAINVDTLIENNKDSIVLLRQRIALHQQHDPKLELSLGHELVHQLETDPEISYQAGRIRREVALLIPRVREVTSKRDLANLTTINFDLLVIGINGLSSLAYIPPLEDLKRTTVRLQLAILEYLSLVDEVINFPKALVGVNLHARKESKQLKALKRRTMEIDNRIVEIKTMLTYAYRELLETHLKKMISEERSALSEAIRSKAVLDEKIAVLTQDVQAEDLQRPETGSDDKKEVSSLRSAVTFFASDARVSASSVSDNVADSDLSSGSDEKLVNTEDTNIAPSGTCLTQ
ncbi:hypothetical protein [Legionella shakespearei]|uniref:Coiled-coil-containing protein n=1 Tax=Legionella shakespearei DSM 23087 TaxID=1122169 RepID=A0A0W0Z2C7_9GAMM|nr:hypothetical protein [Legionella shakespearei]KTD63316.1 coiled-coil-containing protein [Legionella shakespearei DSM 23087]